MNTYGKELIMDLHRCDPTKFTRKHLRNYIKELCILVDMQREKICWWDDLRTPEAEKEWEPHLVGTTVVQFIKTSNVTIHTLDMLEQAYINLFSCKDFDSAAVLDFTADYFDGLIMQHKTVERM